MSAGTEPSAPRPPARGRTGRLVTAVRVLPPNAFGFVLATGIVSLAFHLTGWELASLTLAGIAVGGLLGLAILLVWRFVSFRSGWYTTAVEKTVGLTLPIYDRV